MTAVSSICPSAGHDITVRQAVALVIRRWIIATVSLRACHGVQFSGSNMFETLQPLFYSNLVHEIKLLHHLMERHYIVLLPVHARMTIFKLRTLIY